MNIRPADSYDYDILSLGEIRLRLDPGNGRVRAAQGALAMTTPGDTTMATKGEVEALMKGISARVKR
jgi:2-dehydro-3-deoxygluconokinase